MDHHDKLFDLGLRENNKEEACLTKIEALKDEKDECCPSGMSGQTRRSS